MNNIMTIATLQVYDNVTQWNVMTWNGEYIGDSLEGEGHDDCPALNISFYFCPTSLCWWDAASDIFARSNMLSHSEVGKYIIAKWCNADTC